MNHAGIIQSRFRLRSLSSIMESKRTRRLAMLQATFAVIVWGASFIATKIALKELSPMEVIILRFGIGTATVALFVFLRKEFSRIAGKDFLFVLLLGFLGIAFHQWLQSTGLQTAEATTTAWIITTIPVFILILGKIFLKERTPLVSVTGIILAAVGVLLIVSKGEVGNILRGTFGKSGDFLILMSALNWAVFSILSRKSLRRHASTNLMLHVLFLGWMMTCVAGFGTSLLHHQPIFSQMATLSIEGTSSILFLGLLCSGFAYIFWYDALKHLPATQVGVFLYVEPLIAMIVAYILLDEQMTMIALLGGGLILLGVYLVNKKPAED